MDKKQTDNGTVVFNEVEILCSFQTEEGQLIPTIRPHIAKAILIYILLGIAEGALEEAKKYTKNESRPWVTSNVNHATNDPYIGGHSIINYPRLHHILKYIP